MATVGSAITSLLNEMDRNDLTAEVSAAIVAAVDWYKDTRFWFNDGQFTFVTATQVETYSIDTVLEIDSVAITINGFPRQLNARPFEWIDRHRSPTYKGYPIDYAIFANQMWVHPIPTASLTIVVSGCLALSTLSGTADTNAWLTEGYELIRYHAKADIYANILGEPDTAQTMLALEDAAFSRLKEKTISKEKGGGFIPTQF